MLLGIILLLCSFSRAIVCKTIPTSNANCKVLGEHVLGDIYEIRIFDYPFRFDKSLEYDSCEHSFIDEEEPNEVRPLGTTVMPVSSLKLGGSSCQHVKLKVPECFTELLSLEFLIEASTHSCNWLNY